MNPFYAAPQSWIRARLARLLNRDAWARLLQAGSAEEFRRTLEDSWAAGALAADGRLRTPALRGEVWAATRTLGRFLPRGPKQLLAWYNRRFEIENLKILLRAAHYRVDRARAGELLVPLEAGKLQWAALLGVSPVAALLDPLRNSSYARPLEQALERYEQEQRLFHLEVALDLFYFQQLVRLMESQSGATDAVSQLGRWISVQNLIWAYRYRIYGRMKPEEILNYTLHRAFRCGLETVRRVVLGSPLEAEAGRLGFRLSPGRSEVEALTELEFLAERERYQQAEAMMRQPLFRLGGILAFLCLLESEIRDLGVIAEGKASGLDRAEIAVRLLRAA